MFKGGICVNIEIANRLVKLRKENNLSQEALANKLGVSRQAVSKWERAEASPDTDNLILLSKLYGISLDELLKTDQEEFESGNNKTEKTDTLKEDKVHISLKHGIHVNDKNGDEVHVGWDGIHVKEHVKNQEVHVDSSGVRVNDKTYSHDEWKKQHKDDEWSHYYENYTKFPFALIIIVIYLIMAFYTGNFHPLWIMLLLIPIIEGAISAIKYRDLNRFPYPILLILYFLYEGFCNNVWSPTWVVFLTIPVYYALVNYFKYHQKNKK